VRDVRDIHDSRLRLFCVSGHPCACVDRENLRDDVGVGGTGGNPWASVSATASCRHYPPNPLSSAPSIDSGFAPSLHKANIYRVVVIVCTWWSRAVPRFRRMKKLTGQARILRVHVGKGWWSHHVGDLWKSRLNDVGCSFELSFKLSVVVGGKAKGLYVKLSHKAKNFVGPSRSNRDGVHRQTQHDHPSTSHILQISRSNLQPSIP
jgi:hypothetical protein